MMYLPESEVTENVRLPWEHIKTLAVLAYMSGMTFNQFVESAMRDYILQHNQRNIT